MAKLETGKDKSETQEKDAQKESCCTCNMTDYLDCCKDLTVGDCCKPMQQMFHGMCGCTTAKGGCCS
ncbi:hypothetical protein BVY04_02955 [bacterium M21]|nr:hypothetical protein BVY04_02955 [bacterium M21]